MKEIKGKLRLVRVSASFELVRVKVIGSRRNQPSIDSGLPIAKMLLLHDLIISIRTKLFCPSKQCIPRKLFGFFVIFIFFNLPKDTQFFQMLTQLVDLNML